MHLENVTIKLELAHFGSLNLLHQHISPVQVPVLEFYRLLRHCQCVSNLEQNCHIQFTESHTFNLYMNIDYYQMKNIRDSFTCFHTAKAWVAFLNTNFSRSEPDQSHD